MIILLLILLMVFNCFVIHVLNKCDIKGNQNVLLKKENIYTKRLYYIIPSACLLIFIFGNFIFSGRLFTELFYKLESDFGMDFHVFLSESVLLKECYIGNTEGFNPPLIKLLSLFLYRSFPSDYQSLYYESAINNQILDIRLLVQAFIPFIIFITFSTVTLSLILYHYKKGNSLEKAYYVFLSLINIGIFFAIERGNYILLSLPFALFFVINCHNKNSKIKELSLIALGISAGIKVYPCLLGILLVKEKRWKDVFHCMLYGILFVFGPFLYYGGVPGALGFLRSLGGTGETSLRMGTLNLTSFFYTVQKLFGGGSENEILSNIHILRYFSYLLFLAGIIYVFFIKEYWKTILMIVTLIILYAGTAHTYMLSLLLLPIFLFINEKHSNKFINYIYMLLFIILSSITVFSCPYFLSQIRLETNDRVTLLMIIQQFALIYLFVFQLSEGITKMIGTIVKRKH